MKEGDYFRWSYKNEPKNVSYKHLSKLALVENRRLVDLSQEISWPIEEALEKLTLTFVENLDNLELTDEPEYYALEDAVDLKCPNNLHDPYAHGFIFIRKGAKKDKQIMLDIHNQRLQRAKLDLECAKEKVEELTKTINELNQL